MDAPQNSLPIATVAQATGIAKDTLRAWERRYGFPRPLRDAAGDRLYPPDQVDQLHALKRLLDVGLRPGKLLRLDPGEWPAMARERSAPPATATAAPVAEVLHALRGHDAGHLAELLQRRLTAAGLREFVLCSVAPLCAEVGEAWMRGELRIHQEHLFSRTVESLLGAAARAFQPAQDAPRALLATETGEEHGLGLAMLEAMLALEGCRVASLGTNTPPAEIVAAAHAHRADVVALSYSVAFPRRIAVTVPWLRRALPESVDLWIGGAGASRLAVVPEGVVRLARFDELAQHVARVRSRRDGH